MGRMKIETVHITTRNPRNDRDPGECEIVSYVVENNNTVKLVDKDGAMLRFAKGEPCRQVLGPGDDPRQIASRLGLLYHRQYNDRSGFWRDLGSGGGSPV